MAFIIVNPIIDLLSEQQPSIFYIDDATAFFKCVGDPNNAIFANAGSVATNTSGQAWLKTTGLTLNTGWLLISTSATLSSVQRIETQSNIVGNVGVGLDDLHTGTVVAGSLASDGQFIDFYSAGLFAANVNTKRFVAEIAGQGTLLDTTLLVANGGSWIFSARMTRTNSTNIRCTSSFFSTTALFQVTNVTDIGVLNLALNDFFPKTRGESGIGTSNDIVENLFETIIFR